MCSEIGMWVISVAGALFDIWKIVCALLLFPSY
jgi:hypothetical protein